MSEVREGTVIFGSVFHPDLTGNPILTVTRKPSLYKFGRPNFPNLVSQSDFTHL